MPHFTDTKTLTQEQLLDRIKQPVEEPLKDFIRLFEQALCSEEATEKAIFERIKSRAGKRLRPILTLLTAKAYVQGGKGEMPRSTLHGALGLELLHTASLVHDDVVDESAERRGISSLNAVYGNKIAVLVGDYILSTALLQISQTNNVDMVAYLARLGQTLSSGEILQLSSVGNEEISESVYMDIIAKKTGALFAACCAVGALSAGCPEQEVRRAEAFGRTLGMVFQIQDDILDFYPSPRTGKPSGNDMREGKLTLPVIYALRSKAGEGIHAQVHAEMLQTAHRVKSLTASKYDILRLVAFAKQSGGIEYAKERMQAMTEECLRYVATLPCRKDVKDALVAYLLFIVLRDY